MLVTKFLHRLETVWNRSSEHKDGAKGETRIRFESVVLSINWSPNNNLQGYPFLNLQYELQMYDTSRTFSGQGNDLENSKPK